MALGGGKLGWARHGLRTFALAYIGPEYEWGLWGVGPGSGPRLGASGVWVQQLEYGESIRQLRMGKRNENATRSLIRRLFRFTSHKALEVTAQSGACETSGYIMERRKGMYGWVGSRRWIRSGSLDADLPPPASPDTDLMRVCVFPLRMRHDQR